LSLAPAFHPFSGAQELELAAHALSAGAREIGDDVTGIVRNEGFFGLRSPEGPAAPSRIPGTSDVADGVDLCVARNLIELALVGFGRVARLRHRGPKRARGGG
jgi:hypothetical protein